MNIDYKHIKKNKKWYGHYISFIISCIIYKFYFWNQMLLDEERLLIRIKRMKTYNGEGSS